MNSFPRYSTTLKDLQLKRQATKARSRAIKHPTNGCGESIINTTKSMKPREAQPALRQDRVSGGQSSIPQVPQEPLVNSKERLWISDLHHEVLIVGTTLRNPNLLCRGAYILHEIRAP